MQEGRLKAVHGQVGGPALYRIRVYGQLDAWWSEWFGGMALSVELPGETKLSGVLPDQAALYGQLDRIRDLGLILISVERVELAT